VMLLAIVGDDHSSVMIQRASCSLRQTVGQ
jgi:hypothetical protein